MKGQSATYPPRDATHERGSRTAATTCWIASITSSGWSWWMLCPLSVATIRRASGTSWGEILLQREHDPFHLVTRPAWKWVAERDAMGQHDQRHRAQGRILARLAYLAGGGVVRQRGGIPLFRLRIGIEEVLVGDGERFERHCHVGECGRPGRIRGVTTATPSYKGHRYPVEIINHCVWLYFRFPLSFREVEELMLVRGVAVSYETIRRWCAKFGQAYANQLRRRRPRPGDKWHLDEVFVGINGRLRYLWRAVDQHGNVLDVLVQSRRNAAAAKRFFRKLLKGLRYVPRVLVTDKLGSYQVAHRALMSSVEHRRSRYLNRAENSHQPTRQRERAMKRFKSSRHAQRFLSAFSGISAHFRPRRHLLSATEWRTEMADRFAVWRQVTAPDAAA